MVNSGIDEAEILSVGIPSSGVGSGTCVLGSTVSLTLIVISGVVVAVEIAMPTTARPAIQRVKAIDTSPSGNKTIRCASHELTEGDDSD